MRPVFHGVLLGVSLCYLGACGSDNPAAPQVGRVSVTPDSVKLYQLDSIQLHASVLDMDGHPMSGKEVTYTSSDTTRLKVSALGMAVSRGSPGKVTVAVKTEGAETDVPVDVLARSTSLQLAPDPAVVAQQGNLQLNGAVLDALGNPIPELTVTYTSLSTSLATVRADGLLHSIGPAGTARIQLNGGGLGKVFNVAITPVPTTLQVTPTGMLLTPSADRGINPAVLDLIGDTIAAASATYHSENAAIATVSAGGVVHAVGPLGSTGIEVTSLGLTDTIPVSVIAQSFPLGTIVHTSPVTEAGFAVAISADGVVYSASYNGFLSRADLPGYTMSVVHNGGMPYAVAFSPDGTLAYVAGIPSAGFTAFRVSDNTAIDSVGGLVAGAVDVKLSPDGQTIYVATDARVYAFDRATLNETHEYVADHPEIHLAIGAGNGRVYASGLGKVDELDGTTLAHLRTFTQAGLVQGVALSADGNTLYEANQNGHFQTIDLTTGNNGKSIATCQGYGLVVATNGLIAYMSCPPQGKIEIIDLPHMLVSGEINTGGSPRRMAFDASGLLLAVGNEGVVAGGWVDFVN